MLDHLNLALAKIYTVPEHEQGGIKFSVSISPNKTQLLGLLSINYQAFYSAIIDNSDQMYIFQIYISQ